MRDDSQAPEARPPVSDRVHRRDAHEPSVTPDPLAIAFAPDAGIVLRVPAARDDQAALASLMSRVQLGDAVAFRTLHDRCASRLLGAATRIVNDRELAREAVSAALLQAWRRAADFDPARGGVMTWLCTLARSRAIDMIRRDRTRGRYECAFDDLSADDMDGQVRQPADELARAQSRRLLRRAMSVLSPVQRHVLSLTFLQGHGQEEAAAQIGVPLGTLKSHARRGLAALREHRGLGQLDC